jgi:glycosyltransferase involved in cell wall biosynthesis
MKVCIITNIPSPYRVDLFNHLIENSNYDITIIYSSKNEDNRLWKIESTLLKNSVFLKSKTIKIKKKNDYKYIHIPVDTISTLNKINPDLVIASEYNPTVLQSFIWCKRKKKKFVSWSDGTLNSEKSINIIQKFIRKIMCRQANALIASSSKTKEAQIYYGADCAKIFVSYLTIDVKKFLIGKKDYDNKNIIFVGSLIKRKGIDLLIKSLSKVDSNFYLRIVGNGEEKDNLIDLCRHLKIENKIEFCGFKSETELSELYKISDIFILPSREDCFGLVINEAMCAGLPVIVSKYADGSYDLVQDGFNGFIIDPYDIDNMSDKINILLNDKELLQNMGANSKDKIQDFTLENVSKNFIEAIEYSVHN